MSEIKDPQQHPKVEIQSRTLDRFKPTLLRPLTVFVGPSNTGKTYFASGVCLMVL